MSPVDRDTRAGTVSLPFPVASLVDIFSVKATTAHTVPNVVKAKRSSSTLKTIIKSLRFLYLRSRSTVSRMKERSSDRSTKPSPFVSRAFSRAPYFRSSSESIGPLSPLSSAIPSLEEGGMQDKVFLSDGHSRQVIDNRLQSIQRKFYCASCRIIRPENVRTWWGGVGWGCMKLAKLRTRHDASLYSCIAVITAIQSVRAVTHDIAKSWMLWGGSRLQVPS